MPQSILSWWSWDLIPPTPAALNISSSPDLECYWAVDRESAGYMELEESNRYDKDFALQNYSMNFLVLDINLENLSHVNVSLKTDPLLITSGSPSAKLRLIWGTTGYVLSWWLAFAGLFRQQLGLRRPHSKVLQRSSWILGQWRESVCAIQCVC